MILKLVLLQFFDIEDISSVDHQRAFHCLLDDTPAGQTELLPFREQQQPPTLNVMFLFNIQAGSTSPSRLLIRIVTSWIL